MSAAAHRVQLVICGLGGQGVVFVSRVLAEAVLREGHEVLTSETHGMAQRGGAVDSYVRIGGYRSTVVRPGEADSVLVLDPSRTGAAERYLREGGSRLVNDREGEHACDAAGIARELGNPRGANLVLLGRAASVWPDLYPGREALRAALERLSPPAVREANVAALERGWSAT